jgi:outer membrane biosynthesis protein TonB
MNNENNINGIPSIDDIKIEETPAESFANLYGNGAQAQPAQQPMPNPQPVPPVQPQPMPNPQPVPPVQPQPMPNPQPVPPVQPQPMPNPQPVPTNIPSENLMSQDIVLDIDAERMQSIEEQLSKTSQYKPEDFQQEKIEIPTTNEYEKSKSGLAFVIALFAILILAIVAAPFITKYFS